MKNRNSVSDNQTRESGLNREGGKMQTGTPASQNMKRDANPPSNQRHEQKRKDNDLNTDLNNQRGSVGSRQTGSSPDDIAGVADIDRDLKR